MSDRTLPFDAEQALLGGVIHNNDLLKQIGLHPMDFSHPANAAVWEAAQQLAKNNSVIDEITLKYMLDKLGKSSKIDEGYLAILTLRCPSAENTKHYAEIVQEASNLRQLLQFCSNVGNRIASGADSADVLRLLEEAGTPLGSSNELPTLRDRSLDVASGGGLTTGLGLERYIPGGIPGDKVTVLYGETGTFKTTLKNHLLFRFAEAGYRCLDVSLEDSSALTKARFIAQRTGLPYGALAAGTIQAPELSDEDYTTLGRVVDASQIAANSSEILRLASRERCTCVFVDYLQLLEGHATEHGLIAESMRNFQLYASRERTAIIVLSQVKQDVYARSYLRDKSGNELGDPRPTIRDCFGSASIATHAKLGLGIFRPWSYCKAPVRTSGPYGRYCEWVNNYHGGLEEAMSIYPNILEVSVGKNVLGPSGVSVEVVVNPETGKLTPFSGVQ